MNELVTLQLLLWPLLLIQLLLPLCLNNSFLLWPSLITLCWLYIQRPLPRRSWPYSSPHLLPLCWSLVLLPFGGSWLFSPLSTLVSYGLASGSSLGLHYLLSFLGVRFSNIISVILNSPDGLFLDALSFLCSNITLLLLVSTWFFILGLILGYVVYRCTKTPSKFPSISNQVTVVNAPSKKELSKKQIETFWTAISLMEDRIIADRKHKIVSIAEIQHDDFISFLKPDCFSWALQ